MAEFKPFKPTDSEEAEAFETVFCANCARHHRATMCPILNAALVNDAVDPGFPEQWHFGDKGPECTAYEPGLRRVG